MRQKISFWALICLFQSSFIFGQINAIKPQTQHAIDSLQQRLIKKKKVVSTSLAIIDNGQIVYANGYGFSDKEAGIKASENTIYRVGSCTKTFTVVAIMQLHEKGLLDINHSVKKYLPELAIANSFEVENPILIKDIMAHISGLPSDVYYGFFANTPPDVNSLISALNQQQLIYPRAYKTAYSNVAYSLLGEVVKRVSGAASYEAYLQENIFKPLQMTASFVSNNATLEAQLAKPYIKEKPIYEPPIRDKAAGFIHSNVVDMAHFMDMLLQDGTANKQQILSAKSVAMMEQNQVLDIALPDLMNDGYGYGLTLKNAHIITKKDTLKGRIIGHNGSLIAYHADFKYIPELNIGAVILTNSQEGAGQISASKLLRLYLQHEKGKKLKSDNTLSPAILQKTADEQAANSSEIIGRYVADGAVNIKVDNPDKIKFKLDGTKVVLKKKEASPNYSISVKLLGFIPIKLKTNEVAFVKKKEAIFFKMLEPKHQFSGFLGKKIHPKPIPIAWQQALGEYQLSSPPFACINCPKEALFDDISIHLQVINDYLVLHTKSKNLDIKQSLYLDIISDKVAMTHGMGQEAGVTIRLLENGNLYYHGFEFSNIK